MVLVLPHPRSNRSSNNGSGQPSNTYGTAVTSGAANTLGSTFTEIIASTSHDAYWIDLHYKNGSSANTRTDALMNIYIGADGSEQVLIPNLLCGWTLASIGGKWFGFPLYIKSGSRLTAKLQHSSATQSISVFVTLTGGGMPPHWVGRKVETLGAVTASSKGTNVTPGTTSEGSFTDIGTSGREYGFIQPMLGGNVPDTTITAGAVSIDIGVGSAALSGLSDFVFSLNANERITNCNRGRFTRIASGTALQIRAQHSGAVTEQNDYCIYGVY